MRLPKIAVFHNRDEPRQAITDVTRAPQADSIIAKFRARSTSARDVTPAKSGQSASAYPIHDTLGLYALGTHDQKKNHETYMGSTGIIEFRYGCDRPGMPEKRGFRTIPRCPKVNLVHRIGLAYHLPDNQ
jgi:hypothetical protein